MSELKKDNLFLKKSFSIFFILILVLMPFSQVSGVSDKSEDLAIDEQDFLDRVVNSFKCAFDKDCYLFEKKLNGKSFLTGFALLGNGGGCPSQNGKFVLSQDYFRELILDNRRGIVTNSPSSLYGSEGIHESELNPFRDPKELEIFLTSHPMTSFGAPENLVNCMLLQPMKSEEVVFGNHYSKTIPAVYATNQEKRFAIGHYYNVVNRIAIGQKAALETMAFIDYLNGDSVLGDISPVDLFLPSVQEHALKYRGAPFGEPDPNQPGVDARSYLRKDYKEILESTLGPLYRDKYTLELKREVVWVKGYEPFSSSWSDWRYENEYNKLDQKLKEIDSVIEALYYVYPLAKGEEFNDYYLFDKQTVISEYQQYVYDNISPPGDYSLLLNWPDTIATLTTRFINSNGNPATLLDLQEAMEAQLKDSRESLRNYIDLSEVALETLHDKKASYGDVKDAIDGALEKSPPVPRFEMNMDDYTSDERLKAYFANQYYTYLPGEVEQMIIARDDAESVALQIAAVPALVIGGAVAGPWATTSGLVRTLSALRTGASVSGTAILGAAVMGGQVAYTYGSIAGANSICTDSFGIWDSYVGSTTRSVKIGDQAYQQRYLGPVKSNDYQSCVVAIVLAGVDIGLTVYTPPRVKQWLETADESAQFGSSARAASEIETKVIGKSVNSFVPLASRSIDDLVEGIHPTVRKAFWGNLDIPTPRKDAELIQRIRDKVELNSFSDKISPFHPENENFLGHFPPIDPFTKRILTQEEVPIVLEQYKTKANEFLDDLFSNAKQRELSSTEIVILERLDSSFESGDFRALFDYNGGIRGYTDSYKTAAVSGTGKPTIFFSSLKDPAGRNTWEIFIHESQHYLDDYLRNNGATHVLTVHPSNSKILNFFNEFRANIGAAAEDYSRAFDITKTSYREHYDFFVSVFPEIMSWDSESIFLFSKKISEEMSSPSSPLNSWLNQPLNRLKTPTEAERLAIQKVIGEVAAIHVSGSIKIPTRNVVKLSSLSSESREKLAEFTFKEYKKKFATLLEELRISLKVEKIEDIPPEKIEELIAANKQEAGLYGVADKTRTRILSDSQDTIYSIIKTNEDGTEITRAIHVFNSPDGFHTTMAQDLAPIYPEAFTYTNELGQTVNKKVYEIGWFASTSDESAIKPLEDVIAEAVNYEKATGEKVVLVLRTSRRDARIYKGLVKESLIDVTAQKVSGVDELQGISSIGPSVDQELTVAGNTYTTDLQYYVSVIRDNEKALEYLRARLGK